MSTNLAESLAKLHAEYGIYPNELLRRDCRTTNIISRIKEYPLEFDYLSAFYKVYCETYLDNVKPNQYSGINTGVARGVDLPFLGEAALKSGKPKLFVAFEGSLTDHSKIYNEKNELKQDAKLSITVLSHLWGVDSEEIRNEFIDLWWGRGRKSYNRLYNKLKITKEIALNVYVTDAERIGNISEKNKEIKERKHHLNRELIHKEIELLKPEIVICIGNTAKNVVGAKYFLTVVMI